jgi:nucleoside-diphosphate-sugar epimerase
MIASTDLSINSNILYKKEIEYFVNSNSFYDSFNNQSILITGASGLIGSCLSDILMYLNRHKIVKVHIYAVGRDIAKMRQRFSTYYNDDFFHLIEQDITQPLHWKISTNYIIHGAGNSTPTALVKMPIDTLRANCFGTDMLLSYGRLHGLRRFLFLSSGEFYGQLASEKSNFSEDYCGYLDYSSPRACYPSGKRAAEAFCQSYISQYDIDVVIARICHVYGPTLTTSDDRAIAQFLRAAAAGQDIVMKSHGTVVRSHCYVFDVAMAILHILLYGEKGQAYNIASKQSTATIRQFAEIAASFVGRKVIFDIEDIFSKDIFSSVNRAVLDSSKIERLGWRSTTTLEEGIAKTIAMLWHNM